MVVTNLINFTFNLFVTLLWPSNHAIDGRDILLMFIMCFSGKRDVGDAALCFRQSFYTGCLRYVMV